MTIVLNGTDGLSNIDGTAATPAIRGTDANTGIFFGTDIIGFSEGGVEAARINADSQFVAAAGTAALPVITTTGDLNTGIFFPAADTIAFSEGGAEAMRIDSSGNVGIGATPGTILDVYKASGNPYIRVYTGTGSVQGYMQAIDSTYVKMGSLSNHDLGLVTNGAEVARLTTAGLFKFNSGYGSVATAYGCRAWVNFNGTTAATNASGNITSVTRTAAGTFTVAFTTAMSDANYVAVGTASSTQYLRAVQTGSSAAGSVVVRTVAENATVVDTSGNVHIAIFR